MTNSASVESESARLDRIRRVHSNLAVPPRLKKKREIVAWLQERFAGLRDHQPLQIGATPIIANIAADEENLHISRIHPMLDEYFESTEYLQAVAAPRAMRRDVLTGEPVEPVSEKDRQYAISKLEERGVYVPHNDAEAVADEASPVAHDSLNKPSIFERIDARQPLEERLQSLGALRARQRSSSALEKTMQIAKKTNYDAALSGLNLFDDPPVDPKTALAEWAHKTFAVIRDFEPLALGIDVQFCHLAKKRGFYEELAMCFLCRHTKSERYLINTNDRDALRRHLNGASAGAVGKEAAALAGHKLKGTIDLRPCTCLVAKPFSPYREASA
jgi:sRNA-binding protein